MTYDPVNFLLLKKEEYNADGELREIVEYHYHDGMLIQKKNLGADGIVSSYHIYAYKGKLPEKDEFYNRVLQSVSECIYDGKGIKTGLQVYDASGKLLANTKYGYRDGFLIQKEIFDASGSLDKYSTITYDENGHILNEIFHYPNGDVERALSYAYKESRLTSKTSLDSGGDVVETVLYEYNEYADVKKIVLLNRRGEVKEITEKKYEYQPLTKLIQD